MQFAIFHQKIQFCTYFCSFFLNKIYKNNFNLRLVKNNIYHFLSYCLLQSKINYFMSQINCNKLFQINKERSCRTHHRQICEIQSDSRFESHRCSPQIFDFEPKWRFYFCSFFLNKIYKINFIPLVLNIIFYITIIHVGNTCKLFYDI